MKITIVNAILIFHGKNVLWPFQYFLLEMWPLQVGNVFEGCDHRLTTELVLKVTTAAAVGR